MRKIIIFCCMLFIIILTTTSLKSLQNTKFFYYAFDRKINLNESTNQLIVKCKENKKSNNKLVSLYSDIKNIPTEWKDDSTFILTVNPEERDALRKKFLSQSDVKVCNPIYKLETGFEMGVTDDILVKFNNNVTEKIKDSLYKKYEVRIYQKSELFDWLILPQGADALQIANELQESGLTQFSQPNFFNKIEPQQVVPNDTYFANQFYLRNVGQVFCDGHSGTSGADNKASFAWATTIGLSNITIAVLDEGLVSDHPDLPNIRQVRLDSSNFADGMRNNPSPTGDMAHGTACSGIIAATQNNNQGISGIAPNCKIMPIRIFNSNGSGISNANLALAIDYVRRHGADIISNSWNFGPGATDPNLIPVIVTAIQNATSYGRGGKGCVVSFSASNSANHNTGDNGEVRFPANVNISGVLTVGASERYDHQANYSPTGNPSSPNNQVIDVVAPSHKAYSSQITGETFEVYSLDIPDNPGYNPVKSVDDPQNGGTLPVVGSILPNTGTNNLFYTARMGGTSSASPQVAAEAALILSINPSLTQQQVYNIITSSADKVGGYSYTNGKSNELGYGRININSAVNQAVTSTNISLSGSHLVCSSGSDFSVNLRSGDAVVWSCGGYLTMVSPQGSNPCRFANSGGAGSSWVEATISSTSGYGTFSLPQYNVWAGVPVISNISGPRYSVVGGNSTYFATVTDVNENVTSFNWTLMPSVYNNYFNPGYDHCYITWYRAGEYVLVVNATNTCGTSSSYYYPITVGSKGYLSVSPNPATDNVQVSIIKPQNTLSASDTTSITPNLVTINDQDVVTTYTIKIYNSLGTLFYSTKKSGDTFTIPVNNLQNGTYIIEANDGKQSYTQQLIVKH